MSRDILRAFAVAMVVVSAACAPPKSDGSRLKIIGGTAVTDTTWSNTVAVIVKTTSGNTSLCTGTVLAPTLVVTAAHCFVEDGTQPMPPAANVTVRSGDDAHAGKGVTHTGQKINVNPNYKNDPQDDMGYIVLADTASEVQIIPPAVDPTELQQLTNPGASATLVGFGTTVDGSTDPSTIGNKYQVVTQVQQPQGGVLFIGGGGKDSCQGDSGGPAFGQMSDQTWRVFGAASRGQACGNGGLYARIADSINWIQQDSGVTVTTASGVPAQGPTTPPAATTGGSTASGGASPASTTPAGSGAAAGGSGASSTNDLWVALGTLDPTVQDAYELDISAPPTIAKISICADKLAACTTSLKEDLGTHAANAGDASRAWFVGNNRVQLKNGLVMTLLGFDATGALAQSRQITVSSN